MALKVCAIICVRNGARRLGPGLAALRAQTGIDRQSLEIVVVDNGSTDDTAATAEAALRDAPFRTAVLSEPKPGQLAAFRRGLAATTADLIMIVDDDNVLCRDFVATTIELFNAHPDVGVIGSRNVAVFPPGHSAPPWFAALAGNFACGSPDGFAFPPQPIDLAIVAGAGSSFRRAPLQAALDDGYEFINDTTREGGLWITGMDTEWCHLFAALGWKFLYDARLRLEHVMTPERLTWDYARRLSRTIGTAAVGVDPFILFSPGARDTSRRGTWSWQLLAKLRRLARHGLALRKLRRPGFVGDLHVIEMERDLGSLLRVWHERDDYPVHLKRTRAFLQRHAKRNPS